MQEDRVDRIGYAGELVEAIYRRVQFITSQFIPQRKTQSFFLKKTNYGGGKREKRLKRTD